MIKQSLKTKLLFETPLTITALTSFITVPNKDYNIIFNTIGNVLTHNESQYVTIIYQTKKFRVSLRYSSISKSSSILYFYYLPESSGLIKMLQRYFENDFDAKNNKLIDSGQHSCWIKLYATNSAATFELETCRKVLINSKNNIFSKNRDVSLTNTEYEILKYIRTKNLTIDDIKEGQKLINSSKSLKSSATKSSVSKQQPTISQTVLSFTDTPVSEPVTKPVKKTTSTILSPSIKSSTPTLTPKASLSTPAKPSTSAGTFLFIKVVDKSLLNTGATIPEQGRSVLRAMYGDRYESQKHVDVLVKIGPYMYSAYINYGSRISFTKRDTSGLLKLRTIFSNTKKLLQYSTNFKSQIPAGQEEYVAFYLDKVDVFRIECYPLGSLMPKELSLLIDKSKHISPHSSRTVSAHSSRATIAIPKIEASSNEFIDFTILIKEFKEYLKNNPDEDFINLSSFILQSACWKGDYLEQQERLTEEAKKILTTSFNLKMVDANYAEVMS